MKKIIEAINSSEKKLYSIGNVSENVVKEAEKKLGFNFPTEIRSFIKEYGSISIGNIEIFGLGVKENSHLNIVNRSKEILSKDYLQEGYLVIEDLGDGHYAIYNKSGVYKYAENKIIDKIESSLEEYLYNSIKELNNI
jgi:hypothetical protein